MSLDQKKPYSTEQPPAPPRPETAVPRPELDWVAPENKEHFESEPVPVESGERSEQSLSGASVSAPVAATPPAPISVKSEHLQKIEHVLEDGLSDLYFQMDSAAQRRFRAEGERTAAKIEQLLSGGKDAAKKIFKLIADWLKLIPGVSKFFIEQEAKIKSDNVLKIK